MKTRVPIPTRRLVNAFHDHKTSSVVLVERVGDRTTLRSVPAEHSFFVRRADLDREIDRALRSSPNVRAVVEEGDYYRIRCVDRDACRVGCERFKESGIDTYDGDIAPVRRYLVDHAPEFAVPRLGYLDIEADSDIPFSRKEEARIFCWVVEGHESRAQTRGVLREDTDEAERELLLGLIEALAEFDQVAAWYGDRYDFPVIRARCKRLGIAFDWRQKLLLDQCELFRRMNMMAASSGEEKQSFALQAISTALLGEGKLDFDSSKTRRAYDRAEPCEHWSNPEVEPCRDCRECLVDYCAQDVRLMPRIEDKTGYIALLQTVADVCRVFPDSHGINPSVQVEGFLLALAKQRGHRFKTRLERGGGDDQYRGAYVLDPVESGIVKGVQICDFASLYPTIIITWNISPETRVDRVPPPDTRPAYLRHLPPPEAPPRPEHCCEAPITGEWFDTREQGVLPFAVDELIRLRAVHQAREKEAVPNTPEHAAAKRLTTAYKITANSFYGVIGSAMSRFFDRRVAEAVTQCGVWLIKLVIEDAERHGMRTIAADTDGAFVTGSDRESFARFVERVNTELLPPKIAAQGCKVNRIKLGSDKGFERLIIPVDGKGKPVAKKYAGRLEHSKGKLATDESAPEIKGLEYKRGDSARLARSMQKEVIDLFCRARCEDPSKFEELCWTYRRRVLDEPIELSDVKVSKFLTKALAAYAVRTKKDGTDAAQPPHVQVARLLQERGRDVGEGAKIEYVCVDGAAKPKRFLPAEDWTGECDRHELWESLVWPPTERLLVAAFPDHDWEPLANSRPRKVGGRRRAKVDETQTELPLAEPWFSGDPAPN